MLNNSIKIKGLRETAIPFYVSRTTKNWDRHLKMNLDIKVKHNIYNVQSISRVLGKMPFYKILIV